MELGNGWYCHPSKTNVDRGKAVVDIGFLGLTISHITLSCSQYLYNTRPKPVEYGYVFSMAVGTIGEWLKLVPFLYGDVQLIGGGGRFLK